MKHPFHSESPGSVFRAGDSIGRVLSPRSFLGRGLLGSLGLHVAAIAALAGYIGLDNSAPSFVISEAAPASFEGISTEPPRLEEPPPPPRPCEAMFEPVQTVAEPTLDEVVFFEDPKPSSWDDLFAPPDPGLHLSTRPSRSSHEIEVPDMEAVVPPDPPFEASAPAVETVTAAEPLTGVNPKPPYPRRAVRNGMQGVVVLAVEVLEDGTAGRVEIVETSGHRLLDEAALEAVRGWRFRAATRGGEPVRDRLEIPFRFEIESS